MTRRLLASQGDQRWRRYLFESLAFASPPAPLPPPFGWSPFPAIAGQEGNSCKRAAEPAESRRLPREQSGSVWRGGLHGNLAKRAFRVELIKPSHYDRDGYVIQWLRSTLPSNSLASVYGLMRE